MSTTHKVFFGSSINMNAIENESVNLVVTSPPYPMIEMWDDIMSLQNPEIGDQLKENPQSAFELMHQELDKTWNECYRVLKQGGIMCINIGDATRSLKGEFQLYNNHSRIVKHCIELGFTNLPNIIWRKPTNAPNKFMGSGMLPCGAYVTLEHEYILVFRKGNKREYKTEEDKKTRRESAFFWEERNQWFSDLWDLKGTKQKISKSQTRERSASFPLAIPYRLINMYSQRNDVVLDPYFGLGTTSLAAIVSERNSIGYEIDKKLAPNIQDSITGVTTDQLNAVIFDRYKNHLDFINKRKADKKNFKYHNETIGMDVMTKQELEISLHYVKEVKRKTEDPLSFTCEYYANKSLETVPTNDGGLFG